MASTYALIGADGRPYWSPSKGRWGGHRGSKVYGRLDCPAVVRAIARGGYLRPRVFFADEATAITAGYRPCGTCVKTAITGGRPREGAANSEHSELRALLKTPVGHDVDNDTKRHHARA